MEPICLVSDTHLGIYKSADLWHDVVLKLFKEIADYCDRHNITKIIHLGDFFANRRVLNVKTLDYAHKIASIINGFDTWIVRGNHDQYFKNEPYPHSLIVFRKYKNIHIVDEPYAIDIGGRFIGLVPWNEEFKHLDCTVLMGHFDINGFKMNDGFIQRRGRWNKSDFNGFEQVISGHFHTPTHDIDDINYLGSPYQQNFGDAGSERGFYIWYPDSKNFDFIEFTGAPKYVIIDTEDMQLDEIKGNIVKINFRKDYGSRKNNEILDEVSLREPLLCYTNFTDAAVELTDEIIEDDLAEVKDTKEVVVNYLHKSELPENLELKTVISVFSQLIDSVQEDMK